MKTLKYITLFFLVQSCASAYHPVYPKTVKHTMFDSKDQLDLSYQYDVISEKGNGKYFRRACRKKYNIVSYMLTNNSSDTLVLGKDMKFMNGEKELILSNAESCIASVKQYPVGFLPYLGASFFSLYLGVQINPFTGVKTYKKRIPIGLIGSIPIVIGNMAVANFANRSFYDNLKYYDMNGKAVKPNETIFGLLVFRSNEQIPLKISKTKKS